MQTTLYIKNHRKNWECCPVSLFNCHEFRFSIVRIVIDWPSHVSSSLWWIVSKVTSLCSLVKTLIVQWCQRDQPRDIELFWRAKMETKLVKIPLVLTNQNLCMNQHVACDFGVELSGNWKKKKSGRTTLTYSTALHKFRFGLSPQLKPKFKLHISQLMDFQIQTPEPSAGLGVFFCQGRPLATFESMMIIGFRRRYFGRWSFCLADQKKPIMLCNLQIPSDQIGILNLEIAQVEPQITTFCSTVSFCSL